jgi:diguanylate cyclase (GGDEF)-like protein
LARANRSGLPLCLAYLDIDHFKLINDTCGHLAGDAVLRQIARIITRLLRRSDVVGRIGGEEFLILLPDTNGHSARRIAERLRKRVETAEFLHEDATIPVQVSVGVFYAESPLALGVDELVAQADAALYEAKAAGRNQVVYHEQGLGQAAPAQR